MPDGQMAITLKGNPAHLDDVIQMLQGKPAQDAAGGSPAMPMAAPPPPPVSSSLLGMVMPQNGSADAAGMPMTSMSSLPPRPRSLLGKVEHGLGIAGEIAGTAFAPRLMPFIPGTMQNRMMQEDRAQGLQDEETDRALKGGQAEEAKARAYALMHPAEKGAGEAQATVTSGGQAYEWNPDTQRYDIAVGTGKPGGEAQATVISGGQAYEWNPETSRYDIPIGSPKPDAEKVQPHITAMKDGKPHIMERDPQTGEYSIDRGLAPPNFAMTGLYEPLMANVGGRLVPASFDKRTGTVSVAPVRGGTTVLPRDASAQIGKSMEASRSADTRYRVMVDNENPAIKGNQQAMLNVLANHIGMTMGLQKGARITQAVWNEAQQTAPWLQRVAAKFDKQGYLSGVTLSPEQVKQMVDLGYDRRVREWQQVEDTGRQYGVDISNEIPRDVKKSLQGLGTVEARSAVGPGAAGGGPKVGTVEDGYRFKGGNPADKSSWEKVR